MKRVSMMIAATKDPTKLFEIEYDEEALNKLRGIFSLDIEVEFHRALQAEADAMYEKYYGESI